MANIRTTKLFKNVEWSNRPSELLRSKKTETTGVEKASEPLGKNKRLRAAFNLPQKNAAHPGSLMRGSGNRRQVERISQSGRTPDAAAIIYGQAAKYILIFFFPPWAGIYRINPIGRMPNVQTALPVFKHVFKSKPISSTSGFPFGYIWNNQIVY